MKKIVFVVFVFFVVSSSMSWGYSIGLYADAAGTSCDLPATFPFSTWYLVATFAPGEDMQAAEFRITGLPATWTLMSETPPTGVTVLGTSAFDSTGMAIVWPSCESATPVLLLTIQVFAADATVFTLNVIDYSIPSLPCAGDPVIVECTMAILACAEGGEAYVNHTGCTPVPVELMHFSVD